MGFAFNSMIHSNGFEGGGGDLNMTAEEYLEAVKGGLWSRAEVIPGFESQVEVDEAGRRATVKPMSSANVEADPRFAEFVRATAPATANARLAPGVRGEKFLALTIRNNEVVVLRVGVLGGQGGDITNFVQGAGAIAHVHPQGLVQRPGPGDNSPPRSGIPNFMIGHSGTTIWEVGVVNNVDMYRRISGSGAGEWRRFKGR